MRRSLVCFLVLLALGVGMAWAEEELTEQRLFHLERNKNANIVVYDARVQADGNLPKEDPVIVYWLKLAEDGARKNLKGIEKKLAYGFKIESREGNRLELKMKADVGRMVTVDQSEGRYRAFIDIDGHASILEKIYVFADESGLMPKVIYIELFGSDAESGEERYEKIEA